MYTVSVRIAPRMSLWILPIGAFCMACALLLFLWVDDLSVAMVCLPIFVGMSIVAAYGSTIWVVAIRQGWTVELGNSLIIDHWPFGRRTVAWEDIHNVERFSTTRAVTDPLLWLPHVTHASRHLVAFEFREYSDKMAYDMWFRFTDRSGATNFKFQAASCDIFPVQRWFSRRSVHNIVRFFGGDVSFEKNELREISLRGSKITSAEWAELMEQFHAITTLEKIDLSETDLGDDDIADIEKFSALISLNTTGSRVTARGDKRVQDILEGRRNRGQFDDFAHVDAPKVSFEFLQQ